MIDTTAEYGWLSVCLSCQMMMQCIIQARWPAEPPVTTLPNVEMEHVHLFKAVLKNSQSEFVLLNALKVACENNYERLAKPLRREFDESQIEEIYAVRIIVIL